jgi:FYVE zinc finger
MSIAQSVTRGVARANIGGSEIPEVSISPDTALSNTEDIHFGINIECQLDMFNNPITPLYQGFDYNVALDRDLMTVFNGLGPRSLEIKRRGGRTAEHDFEYNRDPQAQARGLRRVNSGLITTFNSKLDAKKPNYPLVAKRTEGGVTADLSGQPKEYGAPSGATLKKSDADGSQFGARWSKSALEHALGFNAGKIYFHLTGLGDVHVLLDKSGNYGFNVTARELRYIRRFWVRFHRKVVFLNGYTPPPEKAVIVYPPWVNLWEPDTATDQCRVCHKPFSRVLPIRWRHHCRLCGRNVCDDCSKQRVNLTHPVRRPGEPEEVGSVRLCDRCVRPAPSDFS